MALSLVFPDSTYSSSNKPSVVTLQGDLSAVETAVNANETDIATNTAGVATNVSDIATASSDLTTHEADTSTHGVSEIADAANLPVKATGAEIDTGTNDTKFVTPKAITDSKIYRNLPRTGTVASNATPTINTDNIDEFTITALATAVTSMTTNLSGTPVNGQKLIIRFLDNGTARAIAWGASFASRGATLPVTTVISKYLYVGLIYNSTASKWDCVAVANE